MAMFSISAEAFCTLVVRLQRMLACNHALRRMVDITRLIALELDEFDDVLLR